MLTRSKSEKPSTDDFIASVKKSLGVARFCIFMNTSHEDIVNRLRRSPYFYDFVPILAHSSRRSICKSQHDRGARVESSPVSITELTLAGPCFVRSSETVVIEETVGDSA